MICRVPALTVLGFELSRPMGVSRAISEEPEQEQVDVNDGDDEKEEEEAVMG
jgi:hypothetical protein